MNQTNMDNEQIDELQRELETLKGDLSKFKSELTNFQEDFLKHEHTGYDGKRISKDNLLQNIKAVGSVTMSTNGRVYKIGLPSGCRDVFFNGFASHYGGDVYGSGTRDVRVMVVGSAQLGRGYNLQPDSTSSVVVGGLLQDITQSSTNQTVLGSTLTTNVSEYYICSVLYPDGATNPVRASITKYTEDYIEVTVTLSAGWGIVGNFVFT